MSTMEKPAILQQSLQQHQQQPIQQQTTISAPPSTQHILFNLSPLDVRDDIDERVHKNYNSTKQLIVNKTAKECHDIYLKHIAANPQDNTAELTLGLLVAILVEQESQQSRYYRDVVTISKDGLVLFSHYVSMLIVEKLNKIKEQAIKQIFWVAQQLVKANINTAETITSNILRQMGGGDLSTRNLWLVEASLDFLIENRNWVVNQTQFMIPTVIYTFLRLISDHMGAAQNSLRKKEVDFVIELIREKFSDALKCGRDFLRLLSNVTEIPEFEKLMHDIYNKPKSLYPNFQGPLQILSLRTPRRLLQSRLTFEIERKISFLATQVKFGNQKRYQDWFHKQYLSSPESLTLRCDLIRYICSIIHPSNEVLCSDIIPRWAIIGWLLTTCTTSASAAKSKLALFYDWLLYDTKIDNIMNIEPAILVMYYSMRSHPTVTSSLLEYLCRIPTTFSPKLCDHIKGGIKKSLQQILEKRVIQSLAPLFDNPKHDPSLRALIRDTYPEFCVSAADNGLTPPATATIPSAHPSLATIHNNGQQVNKQAQQPEVIVLEQDKSESVSPSNTPPQTSSSNPPASISSSSSSTHSFTETAASAKAPLVQENPHENNKSLDQPIINLGDDKLDQSSTISSTLSPRIDEAKAFSWNGTENVNASYSHKQNHDNKNRKSSVSNSSAIHHDLASKRNKDSAPTSTEATNDPSNNITRYANPSVTLNADGPDNIRFINVNNNNQDNISTVKVRYSFMTVPDLDFKESLDLFEEPIRSILDDISIEKSKEARLDLMDKLISDVFDNSNEQLINNASLFSLLGHCIAYLVSDDFSTRIFPPSGSQDFESLQVSIDTPFFAICRSAFSARRASWTVKPISLLALIAKFLKATGFLVLYYLRVTKVLHDNWGNTSNFSRGYIDFCETSKRKFSKCLQEDLFMALTYDSEMFCFLLPSIFDELAKTGKFSVTGNIEIIHMTVSAIDPVYLQELICLCLTGSARVINKEEVLPLIESSLTWESWEQYCVWKLISAQSVPIENYISILPKLDTKANAEAVSSILLNLQKVSEPTKDMLQQLVNCECKTNDPFPSSILRYWSMRTDLQELARMISSLFDSRPTSPQVKRKGQTKSKNTLTLSPQSEKILKHLDLIRIRAPRNKLLAQPEILEVLSQMETICNDNQKKKFRDLFSLRPKTTKKQKKGDKELSS